MTRKLILTALLCVGLSCISVARDRNRHPFETEFNKISNPEEIFKPGNKFVAYPDYEDRAGWAKLFGDDAEYYIKRGEALMKYEWKVMLASEYLAFEKDGDRKHVQCENSNRGALGGLVIAELAEGKGRFIPQIINGVWFMAEKTSWAYAVHTTAQKSRRVLPEPNERYISLGAANTAAAIAFAWYFFHNEFDKYDPSISKTVLNSLEINTFEPYLRENNAGHWWMGFGKGGVNNWNCYCNAYCLQAFLLAEQDPQKLLAGVRKIMTSLDNYMDYAKMDGACEEGPSYWGMAGAKIYDCAKLMFDATGGKMNLLNDKQVKNMAFWKSKIDLGDGWTVNYGDGGPRSTGEIDLPFRMGCDLGSDEMKKFSLSMIVKPEDKRFDMDPKNAGGDLFRKLEEIRFREEMIDYANKMIKEQGGNWDEMQLWLRKDVKSEFYPETETAVLRNEKGWILAPKGGYNGESHNHNDVGSAILFIEACPIFIDPGSGTYGKNTFNQFRYTKNWQMRSESHNLVTVNGEFELEGSKSKAKDTKCNLETKVFSTDIAAAFPESAACKTWVREFKLGENDATITETFELSERKTADDIHFVTPGKVTLSKKGEILLKSYNIDQTYSQKIKITYPKSLTASVETVNLENPGLVKSWGDFLYRIVLKSSEKAPLNGKYEIKITKQ